MLSRGGSGATKRALRSGVHRQSCGARAGRNHQLGEAKLPAVGERDGAGRAYNRVLLSPLLAEEISADDIEFEPPRSWRDRGVTVRYGCGTSAIDCAARLVSDHGDRVPAERACGQLADQTRRRHAVAHDHQGLAHGRVTPRPRSDAGRVMMAPVADDGQSLRSSLVLRSSLAGGVGCPPPPFKLHAKPTIGR